MLRKIININEDLCVGCGLCVNACQEGAIAMVNGKARLVRDDYCDGLGNCLPVCPTGAISFEMREAAAFDEAAVSENQKKQAPGEIPCGCPGTMAGGIERKRREEPRVEARCEGTAQSELSQWPVQIKLVAPNARFFDGAKLLIAADCTAFAYGDFHRRFIKNHVTLIGCPKLDEGDYSEKLTEILKQNDIKKVTAVRMEVPCCGGIENAVKTALKNCGKLIPWQVVVITRDGRIIEE